jgi:uncharacterized membrane protein YdfJ with MMPL/SSD domain
MLRALADLAGGHPKRVVATAIAAAIAAGAFGFSVADRLHPYGRQDKATESVKADDRLERATGLDPEPGLVVLVETPQGVESKTARKRVEGITRELRREREVGAVASFYSAHDRAMVARGGKSTYVAAHFRAVSDKQQQEAAERVIERLKDHDGVWVGGVDTANLQANRQVEHDIQRAELLAFPLLFLLSLLFFRSLVAAALPLLVGALAIVGTFAVLRLLNEVTEVSIFALNLTTGLGLGLAIDYSLFIVSRYREELARLGPGREALRRTLATAGRAVLFSSITVAAALASLIVFPQRFLYSMGMGGASVALIAALIALVVLPAVLALLGPRVNALAPKRLQRAAERDARPTTSGSWYRLAKSVMRRPALVATAAATFLLALGIPFLGTKFISIDTSVLPENASARVVEDKIQGAFPPHRTTPAYLAVRAQVDDRRVAAFAKRLRSLESAAAVSKPQRVADGMTRIDVISRAGPVDDASRDLVERVRDLPAPFAVEVSGQTAAFLDQRSSQLSHLPLALAIIVTTTTIVLFLMTGSVVLPIKQLLMNVLTLSAVFGILTWIFQDGRLEGVLDYTSPGALEITMPVLLFAVAFGLSTDYGVFLLSRIKEARDGGAPNGEAVAIGLERTGRIVTAAALLFAVAIGAFATSKIIFIKENGIGTALAVLLDATIVRALLVPALMQLLGEWNWWAPAPLRRLHERFGVSEFGPDDSAGSGDTRVDPAGA